MLRTWSVSSACVVRHPCTFLPELVTHCCLGHLAWSFCLAVGSAPAAVVAWLFVRHSKQAPGPRAFAVAVRCCALPCYPPAHSLISSGSQLNVLWHLKSQPTPLPPSFLSPVTVEFSSEHLVVGWPESSFGVGPASVLFVYCRCLLHQLSEGGCIPSLVSCSSPGPAP